MSELPEVIRAERLALLDFLETLSPAEWATPSLCAGWTVQHVAAHLAWAPAPPSLSMAAALVKARFRINKVTAELAVSWSDRGRPAILEQLRRNAADGAKPVGVPQVAALADAVVHAIDIRRPLCRSRPIPHEAFRPTADFFACLRWPLTVSVGGAARRRIQGLRLVACDLGWSHGPAGAPEVRGSGEALMLVLTGRPFEEDELTGSGVAQLNARC